MFAYSNSCCFFYFFFFFNDPATPEIYTLSLHDALPILINHERASKNVKLFKALPPNKIIRKIQEHHVFTLRSEEHTSELQSLAYLVCRLLLEKKNYQTD